MSIKIENDDDNIANIENLQVDIKRLSAENIRYSELVKEQTEEIHDLKNSVKMKTDISNQINKNFSKFRTKSEKENAVEKKSHQAEIKYWKKELGSERKQKIKLEKILAEKKSSEKEIASKFSDSVGCVCDKCDETFKAEESESDIHHCQHSPQCVIRQPYPPPSPLLPHIVHEVSKYHEHMMNKNVDELTGCISCFSIDNDNYGCDKCTWLKWWYKWHGERHGLPDIHQSVYKKYQ